MKKTVSSYEKKILLFSILAGLTAHLLFLRQEYFMDEGIILRNILHFFKDSTLSPENGLYPTFYSYVSALPVAAAIAIKSLFINYNIKETAAYLYTFDLHYLMLPARIISNFSLAIAAAYFAVFSATRFNPTAAYFTAALILLTPAFLRYGSYGLPDITVMLFAMISFLTCIKADEDRDNFTHFSRYAIASAIFCGLAISAKYNGVATIFPIITLFARAIFDRQENKIRLFMLAILSAMVIIVIFIATNPSWIISTDTMLAGVRFQMDLATHGHQGSTGIPLLGQIVLLFEDAPIVLLLAASSLFFYSRKENRLFIFGGSLIIGMLALSMKTSVQSTHYLYPLFPALFLLCAFSLSKIFGRFGRNAIYLASLILIGAAFHSLYTSSDFLQENNAMAARQWIYENIPEDTIIAVENGYVPYLYSDKRLYEREYLMNHPKIIEELKSKHVFYTIEETKQTTSWLTDTSAKFILTSEGIYKRYFENNLFINIAPDPATDLGKEYLANKKFYENLLNNSIFEKKKIFSSSNGHPVIILERIKK